MAMYHNGWTIPRTGLYRAEGPNRPSWCLSLTYRALIIYRAVQNIAVTRQSSMLMLC